VQQLETQIQSPQPPQPAQSQAKRRNVFPVIIITVLLVVSLVGAASIYTLSQQVSSLQSQITSLQSTITTFSQSSSASATAASATSSTTLSDLYKEAVDSVVTIDCTIVYTYSYSNPFGRGGGQTYTTTEEVQGSGFAYEYNGQMVIITNNHVIEGADSITVTFSNGNNYTATVIGSDATLDLAVLSTDAPTSAYYPLTIESSSTVTVGESVVVIGSPYGLNGTMTTGIISALDRSITVTEDSTTSTSSTSYEMTGLIQTSAPINSGNSGGPLMTYDGKVIGITTAIVSNSDGLGFAVPSDTILSFIEKVLG
jgi:S1-C subfamily serine protease